MTDLMRFDATALAELIRERKASSLEVVRAAVERIERLNPRINAVVTPLFDEAIDRSRRCDADVARRATLGPLHGVPVLIKDLFDFKAGVRNTYGCPAMAEFVPNESCAHVSRLEQAGAIILGKTNTPEFGHKGITDNRLFGPTSTPFNLACNAGGSSGGSAAAVAAGMVPLRQGSDAGGSVRIPAAWCGVVGFKPSYGRIPLTGGPNAFGSHTPFVHVGPLARTVRDAALMTHVLAGPHRDDPFSLPNDGLDWLSSPDASLAGMKIGVSAGFGVFEVEPQIANVVQQATAAFADAGAEVIESTIRLPLSQRELADLWRRQVGIFYAEFFAALESGGLPISLGELPEEVQQMTRDGQSATALDARRDDWLRTKIYRAAQDAFDSVDLMITPTNGCAPVFNVGNGATLGPDVINGVAMERCIGWCLTHPINFTGHPAVSVPAGLTGEGLPVGLQIIGRRFADGTVLAASCALEERRPWLPALEHVWCMLDGLD